MALRSETLLHRDAPAVDRAISGTTLAKTGLRKIRNFLVAEDGPTAVEYAVMLALVIIICISAINLVGQETQQSFNKTSNSVSSAMKGAN
jgi:pilus assembly protein Flp/PilA